jgi:hypothetical protein
MTDNETTNAPILTTNDVAILDSIAEEYEIFQRRVKTYTGAMSNPEGSKVQKRTAFSAVRHAGVALRGALRNLNALSKVD